MNHYYYQDNAFWTNDTKTALKCIRVSRLENGKEKTEVLTSEEGDGIWDSIISELTIPGIDASSEKRKQEKEHQRATQVVRDEQQKQAKKLESLFDLKIKAFEVEAIKNCENRKLRSKLRRAENEVEMNALATLIIAIDMGILEDPDV